MHFYREGSVHCSRQKSKAGGAGRAVRRNAPEVCGSTDLIVFLFIQPRAFLSEIATFASEVTQCKPLKNALILVEKNHAYPVTLQCSAPCRSSLMGENVERPDIQPLCRIDDCAKSGRCLPRRWRECALGIRVMQYRALVSRPDADRGRHDCLRRCGREFYVWRRTHRHFKKNRQYHDGNLFVGGRRDLPRLDCRKDERSRVHSLERRSDTGKITEKCSKQR